MNRLLLMLMCTFLISLAIQADTPEYAVSQVPAEMLKNDVVIRKNCASLTIKSESRATYTWLYAVTITKKDAREYGSIVQWYDKYHKVSTLEAVLYDRDGKEIRSLDDDQVSDVSGISNANLYDDYRVKYAEIYHDVYPYTVEIKMEIEISGSLAYPSWYARKSIYPVVLSSFTLTYPEQMQVRHRCSNDTLQPAITKDGNETNIVWKEENLPALSKDAFGDDIDDFSTKIEVAPRAFVFEGREGDMSSWEGLGKWMSSLYFNEQQVLTEAAVQEIKRQYLPSDDQRTKAEKLYRYMQNKTRYVSVQLGIGGWQPFLPSYVHDRGYGDCKALTNYLRVLLDVAGIQSFPVLVQLDKWGIDPKRDFPSNQFNHVILGLPLGNDTLYLECTSNLQPFGKLHEGIENRYALWLAPQGSKLVDIPPTKPENNAQVQQSQITLSPDASSLTLQYKFTGNEAYDKMHLIYEGTPEEKSNWIKKFVTVPDAKIESYSFDTTNILKSIQLTIKATSGLVLSKTGSRLFLQPNLTEKRTHIPEDIPVRYSPVRFSNPVVSIDTVRYIIPAGYIVESLPPATAIEKEWGTYHASVVIVSNSEILYTRKFQINEYKIAANKYADYRKFFAAIVKADKAAVVLVNKP